MCPKCKINDDDGDSLGNKEEKGYIHNNGRKDINYPHAEI